MAWKPIVESGDTVQTPHGVGKVKAVSSNGSARVDVDGQLFEVQDSDMNKIEGAGTPGEVEGAEAKESKETKEPKTRPLNKGEQLEVGDRVRDKISGITGAVSSKTQRTVYVDVDGNGGRTSYNKTSAQRLLEKIVEEPKAEEKPKKKQSEHHGEAKDTADSLFGILQLQKHLENKINQSVDGELKELREQVKKNQKLEVKVGKDSHVVQGLRHKQLEQLISYAMLRLSPLLVGMAGTGKTHAGQQTAEALGLPFYAISVGAQTTKTDIMGYTDANGKYVRTHFRDAYENGGVFLMDEIDAGNANVLITINAALSNGLAAFPDAMVPKHDDFVFIASANTFGNGANRQYVGRNQLDAATLDRFAIIEWFIDDELEENLSFGLNGTAWYMAVKAARDYVSEKKIRALISPRATQKGCKLLDIGQPLDEVIDATMLGSVPDDKKQDVRQVATTIFNKFASKVPKDLPVEVDPPSAADLVKDFDVIPF